MSDSEFYMWCLVFIPILLSSAVTVIWQKGFNRQQISEIIVFWIFIMNLIFGLTLPLVTHRGAAVFSVSLTAAVFVIFIIFRNICWRKKAKRSVYPQQNEKTPRSLRSGWNSNPQLSVLARVGGVRFMWLENKKL